MVLVELKLEINKIEDAKYFAQIIIDNFDDELTKTYGKISLAKVFKYQKDYAKAIKYLYEILTVTKDKMIATVVADELFDVYILDGGAWDRPTSKGKVGSLEEALEIAKDL